MTLLHGLVAPLGNGMVVEVHLDMMETPRAFLQRLGTFGFEDDPFLDFYPPGYHFHYTGRTRILHEDLAGTLPGINSLIGQVMEEARASKVKMYAECELVRQIDHFGDEIPVRGLTGLDGISIKNSDMGAPSAADIHVEFRSGTLPDAVRKLLLNRNFYWVRTPASDLFPSEEIATVQTSVFQHARRVYDRLVAVPLPACTGIHLEQKLGMVKSFEDVPLPPVMDLVLDGDSEIA